MTSPPADEPASGLLEAVAAHLGARADALRVEAVRRAARGLRADDLARPERLADLVGAAVVAETYLFRHPEQLRLGVGEAVAAWQASGRDRLRAWSAGCATGEEPWSLCAALCAAVAPERVDVLGTDVVAAHVDAARRGEYGRWSCREVGPLEWSALAPGTTRVDERLRACARFAVHNLLDAPPAGEGPFDLIACRNVLVYMTDAAARRVLEHLAAALAPGGVLLLGPADLPPGVGVPRALAPLGPSDLLCWSNRPAPAPPTPRSSTAPAPPPSRPASRRFAPLPAPVAAGPARQVAPLRRAAPGRIDEHVAALGEIERGDLEAAERRLTALLDLAPGYALGHLERALVLSRLGRASAAVGAARAALTRVEGIADDAELEGPSPCSAGHVRRSAQALLTRLRGTTT